MKGLIPGILFVLLITINNSSALSSCYNCGILNSCDDPFNVGANANNKIACNTFCAKTKLKSSKKVVRTCLPGCIEGSSPDADLYCCNGKDDCNGVQKIKSSAHILISLCFSSFLYYFLI